MALPNCPPPYVYVPTFITRPPPSIGKDNITDCTMPGFTETRSRSVVVLGGTFFRSKDAGVDANLIEVEYVSSGGVLLNVYYNGVLTETFGPVSGPEIPPILPTPCTPVTNPAMRLLVNGNSNLIEMPNTDFGGQPVGPPLPTFDKAIDETCSSLFSRTFLTGGNGGPTDSSSISSIRTGPQRTMFVVLLSEIINNNPSDIGQLVDPDPLQKIRQWDGVNWIQYISNGDC